MQLREAQEWVSPPTETTHFSWRSNNMSHYKAFEHQHLGEINQSVNQLQSDYANELILYQTESFCQRIFASIQLSKKVWKL
jgi:N-acetyl-gamma-glutamyl-phosphate reductase